MKLENLNLNVPLVSVFFITPCVHPPVHLVAPFIYAPNRMDVLPVSLQQGLSFKLRWHDKHLKTCSTSVGSCVFYVLQQNPGFVKTQQTSRATSLMEQGPHQNHNPGAHRSAELTTTYHVYCTNFCYQLLPNVISRDCHFCLKMLTEMN